MFSGCFDVQIEQCIDSIDREKFLEIEQETKKSQVTAIACESVG